MTFTDEELLAIVDEVTIALGELLQSHRQLTEAFFERQGLEQAQAQIEKKRLEIQKLNDRLKKTRDAIHRRHDLEQIRKRHEEEAKASVTKQTQDEAVNSRAGVTAITDQRGKVIGYSQVAGRQTIFYNQSGKVMAREIGGQTYGKNGAFIGTGQQGMRTLTRKRGKSSYPA